MQRTTLLRLAGALTAVLALSAPALAADEAAPSAPAAPSGGAPPEGHPALPSGHPAMPADHPGVTRMPGQVPTPHPPTPAEQAEAAHQGIDVTASTKTGTTVVPDAVKGQWKAATFVVVDRDRSKAQEVTVDLNGEWAFPGSDLKLKVVEFLPDLRIDNKIYTSASNEPKNPAAHVLIYQGDKEIFDGWLFSQFPQVHKFDHPRFGITLKEGVPT